jgi:hypothetical protein
MSVSLFLCKNPCAPVLGGWSHARLWDIYYSLLAKRGICKGANSFVVRFLGICQGVNSFVVRGLAY